MATLTAAELGTGSLSPSRGISLSWLALVLAVSGADAGSPAAVPAWKITFETSTGIDHGNGRIVGTEHVKIVVTPTETRRAAESTDHGKTVNPATGKPIPLPEATRQAITALLPQLPTASGSYSISDFVNDEGWYGETLSIDRDGGKLVFQLVQGQGEPPIPPVLKKLKGLLEPALLAP